MREKTHPRRRQQAAASPRGGGRRSHQVGTRLRSRPGPICVPDQAAVAQGKQFADEKASPDQERNLRVLIVQHVRREMISRYRDLAVPTLAAAIGCGERKVQQLLQEIRKPDRRESVEFAVEIMRAMLLRRIAGVLCTRHTEETRAVFKMVRDVSEVEARLAGYGSDFREWKAAFDVDYDFWKEERKPWPYASNGKWRPS